MNKISLFLVGCALFLVAGSSVGQDAKKLIVGKWETTQKGPDNIDYKVDAEFFADYKFTMEVCALKVMGKYRFNPDKPNEIETESSFDGKIVIAKQTFTVTQETLELKDTAGQVFKFKRKPSS